MRFLAVVDVLNLAGPDFLLLFAALMLVAGLGSFLLRAFVRPPFSPEFSADGNPAALDPYEAACIGGGPQRIIETAVTALFAAQLIAPNSTGRLIKATGKAPAASLTPVELCVLATASREGGADAAAFREAAKPAAREIHHALVERGMCMAASGLATRLLSAAPWVVLAVIGGSKVVVGFERNRPVVILALLVLAVVIAAIWLIAKPAYASARGQRRVTELKQEHASLGPSRPSGSQRLGSQDAALAVGLFGVAALAGTPFNAIRTTIAPPPAGSSGAGTSSCSSCSSGGGGGGGGCGGCSS